MINNNYKSREQDENSIEKDKSFIETFLSERFEKNPRKIFIGMVAVLLISILISILYSAFQKPYVRKPVKVNDVSLGEPLSKGIGNLITASTSLSELNDLDNNIQRILSKKTLTKKDSIELLNSLEELKRLQEQLNPNKK